MTDPSIPLAIKTPQIADPVESLGRALAIKGQIQQQQAGALGIQHEQMQLDQTKALNDAYKDALTVGQDGSTDIDSGKLTNALGQAGHGSAIPSVLKGIQDFKKSGAELNELNGKVATQRADFGGTIGSTVAAANNDPHLFLTMAQHAAANKTVDPELANRYIQHVQQALQQDPTGETARQIVGQISGALIKQSPAQQKLINEGVTAQAAQSRAQSASTQAGTASQRFNEELPGIRLKSEDLQKQNDATLLAAAARQGPQALADAIKQLPASRFKYFKDIPANATPEQILAIGTTPAEQVTSGQKAQEIAETKARDIANQANQTANQQTAKGRLAVEQGNLALQQKKNEMEYGAGTTEYWVHQLQDNPDSIKEMPPTLRSAVGKGFTAATGLPLPSAASTQTQTSEAAARNALDNIEFIRNAVKNPEIRKQLGPLLGRLGDVEQTVGTAVGLSPDAEKLGQELRTRMRYFQIQEGKALLGGRPNAQLMKVLSGSSANPTMDPGILEGSLKGAEGSAKSILDNGERQRFGGKMRPQSMRSGPGGTPEAATGTPSPLSVNYQGNVFTFKDAATRDQFKKDQGIQ